MFGKFSFIFCGAGQNPFPFRLPSWLEAQDCETREVGSLPSKWGFGVSMLPVGALCFYQAHFGRTVLPKWPLWAHLFYAVFYSVSKLRRACFRQARVARAVLPPGALFCAGAFAFPPCAPRSHMRPLPHLGVSDKTYICSSKPAGSQVSSPLSQRPF